MGSNHPGNPPLIQKRVPTENTEASPIRGTELAARLDDVGRIGQLFARREGLRFLANNAALNNTIDQSHFNSTLQERVTRLRENLPFTANDTLLTLVSTLASIPVAGTGTHFIKGALGSRKYLDDGNQGLNPSLITESPEGPISPIQEKETTLPDAVLKEYYYGKSKKPNGLKQKDFASKPEKWKNSYNIEKDTTNIPSIDRTKTTINIGQPGVPKIKYDKDGNFHNTLSDDTAIDKINSGSAAFTESTKTQDDYVKFVFEILPINSESSTFIQFRSYLDSFDDSFTGDWTGTQYIGRGESFYTYKEFKRSVTLSFKAAAGTKTELRPVYDKLNYLASTTAPSYSGNNLMRGTVVRMTVGSYINNVPGIITSVNYSWRNGYQWEIIGDVLPQVLDCRLSFTPIHDFTPKVLTQDIFDDSPRLIGTSREAAIRVPT
jgi:hypothetical protein